MAQKVFKEAHNETCDAHQVGPKLDYRIIRIGFYLPMMMADTMVYITYSTPTKCMPISYMMHQSTSI